VPQRRRPAPAVLTDTEGAVTVRSAHLRPVLVAALFSSVLALIGVGARTASAADNGRWSVFPKTVEGQRPRSTFVPVLTPGVEVRDAITITNRTNNTLSLELYAADAYNTSEGGFASRRSDEPRRDIAAWITLGQTKVDVPAEGSVDVPFTIQPPTDASPGDHTASIVAVNTEATVSQRGDVNVRALESVGARVYGRVAGAIAPGLEITQLRVRPKGNAVGRQFGGAVDAEVSYKVVNTGNVRLTGQAELRVTSLFGSSSSAPTLTLPELLPRGSAIIEQQVKGVVPFGRLTAEVRVRSAAPDAEAESSVWVIPWVLVVLFLVALVLVVRWWRRRRAGHAGEDAWSEVDEILVEAHS